MRKKKGSWFILSTKTIYQNPWIKVIEDKVIQPDGKKGIFGTVHMKPGVSILPVDDKNNVYLTKEYHYAIEKISIESVSGGIDGQENVLQSAKRKLEEELGLKAKEWTYLGYVDPFTNAVYSPNHLYLAQKLTNSESHPEGTEKIKLIKVPFNQAYQWTIENKITHSASVVLILKVKELLKI